jgi:flagellar M-ring protein FliF
MPDNVTLMDASGRLLTDGPDADAGAVSSQLDYRRALENYLASKAEDMMEKALGPGRTVIRVAADINFQKMKSRKETYAPDGKVVISERTTSTKANNVSAAAAGKAGAASNLPRRSTDGSKAGESKNEEEVTETQFAVSKVLQDFEDKVGAIDRLTVAALVDFSPARRSRSSLHGRDENCGRRGVGQTGRGFQGGARPDQGQPGAVSPDGKRSHGRE